VVLSLSGLPHHSTTPRWIAVSLAVGIVLVGCWGSRRPDDAAVRSAERKRLVARREKLFQDLVRLETEHRHLRGARYTPRREELLAALERVYGALDTDDTSPEPADRTGFAA
jgi:hypothetical protein